MLVCWTDFCITVELDMVEMSFIRAEGTGQCESPTDPYTQSADWLVLQDFSQPCLVSWGKEAYLDPTLPSTYTSFASVYTDKFDIVYLF